MEEVEALSSLPGEHALVAVLRRHAATGELPPWIHQESAYSLSPFLLTAQRERTTAADGAEAWYFFYSPARMEGSSSRFSRTAGGCTWLEERTRPVERVNADGQRVVIGRMKSFSYTRKVRGADKKIQRERLGWILHEVRLPDGHLCCSKLYASPRNAPVAPEPAPLAFAPAAPVASAPAPSAPAPAPSASAPAPLASAPAPSASAPAPSAPAPAPSASAPAPLASAPAPSAPAHAPSAPAPVLQAPAPAPAATKWVKVRISTSPVKSPCYSKKVFEIDDDEENPPKRRLLNCKAWLSFNHLDGPDPLPA